MEIAGDFNAFLWYVKNKSLNRSVWYGVKLVDATVNDSTWDKDGTMVQKDPEKNLPLPGNNVKCKKGHGIITLDYHERPISLRNSIGGERNLQTPYSNCIQVFLGNAKPYLNYDTHEITAKENQISENDEKIKELEEKIAKIDIEISDNDVLLENGKIIRDQWHENYDNLSEKKNKLVSEVNEIKSSNNQLKSELKAAEKQYYMAVQQALPRDFRDLTQNYYYHRTLMEFNTDYVMSLKLFDSKVVMAQLLDALTGCLSIDLNFSYEQLIIKNEVEKMVKMVVETDDAVISDCFFTFSNEQYDNLVRKADLMRAGLFTIDGEENGTFEVNAEAILDSINELNSAASKQEIQTIISGAFNEISRTISETTEQGQTKINFNVRMNFIENLLSNLAYVITSAIVSPKLYLLFAVNLQILGLQSDFSLQDFLDMHRKSLVECIRAIRDKLLGYIVAELLKIIGSLAVELTAKYSIEQAEYYRDLLRRLIECFKSYRRGYLDFNIDNVDYADIIDENGEARNDNC